MLKSRNIIIFIAIAAVLVSFYVFFIKSSPDQGSLVSAPSTTSLPDMNGSGADTSIADQNSLVAKDFLTLLLNVKNIKLDDTIFSDPSFNSLHDSSIVLIPDGNEGRANPFAKFGAEDVIAPPPTTPTTPTTPTVPTMPVVSPAPIKP